MKGHHIFKWLGTQSPHQRVFLVIWLFGFKTGSVGQVGLATRQNWEG